MYTLRELATAISGELHAASEQAVIEHLLTDSRKIIFPATSLFFALHSSRRDGHSFIAEVYERGVRNFVVERKFDHSSFSDANFIVVDSTLHALQALAAWHRSKFKYPVIGITGSNGKTIVKEWLYQLLSPDFNIVRSPRSYNSQTGVPLSVWNMNETHTLAIFEAGISLRGEMEKLEHVIKPDLGVFTTIGDAHSEGFMNIQEKVREKAKLFTDAREVVFCRDKKDIAIAIDHIETAKKFDWSKGGNAKLNVQEIQKNEQSTSIKMHFKKADFEVLIPFTDDASIENAITCCCVCLSLNLAPAVIAERMQLLQAVDMRLQLLPAINNNAIINDSYSFDLNAFQIAIDFLLQQNQYTRHCIIISDLPERYTADHYKQLIAMVVSKKIRRLITIGPKWKALHIIPDQQNFLLEQYDQTEEFVHQFNTNHFRNEAILLKGARVFEFEKLVQLFDKKVHQTVMSINLTAIAHNLKEYQRELKPGVKLMAMVKAYGYGSGSAEVANVLQFHKVDYLAVAYADEGIDLRKSGIRMPLMVLNVDEAAFEAVVEYNLEPELYSFEILQSFIAFVKHQGIQSYPVHIKLDTGMHRLGFEEKDVDELLEILKENKNSIVVKSALSHLAASEDPGEDAFTKHQIDTFVRCCDRIAAVLPYTFIRHISNSAAIFRHHEAQFDMVRLGIGLYGVDSAAEHQLALQTVATLKTTIAQLRMVKAGDTIGYNRRGKVERDSLIATIRIGYADGFSRNLGYGTGKVWINGRLYPVIGTVCMDMTMIDVTGAEDIKVGDEVEIFGPNLPIQQVSQWSKTIAYEILTGISQRVKRVYLEE
ncbi:bifunctional UDP-N-acetylmuramoyl-tripeptide:D-alanyl-D-alanine ligase/alanine racemase [Danxiaibacter flavus]|uniref:Alanine racemase n=1 Tax=Danxiaibacter flavus TaxID=3049108 RepID=A0ABV3ZKX1_9BACT|nr:bifunctional UDP-N-acetylmuramoyl-tripeptide:D-alanyl-D-alanine ligase/alanine racemase [Chitinophagaceae bacterium DXS]